MQLGAIWSLQIVPHRFTQPSRTSQDFVKFDTCFFSGRQDGRCRKKLVNSSRYASKINLEAMRFQIQIWFA
eukprot:scaffold11927_cov174-Skeletonema_menzelii.AAC.4